MGKGKHIFKNLKLLNDYKEDKLTLAEDAESKRMRDELLEIAKSDKSSIVAYTSPSGSGKSTIARKMLNSESIQNAFDIRTCEIWQYDNPDKVWEDFVLTTMSNNDNNLDNLSRKAKYGKTKHRVVLMALIIATIVAIMRIISELYLKDGAIRTVLLTILDILTIAAPIILSLVNIAELVDHLDIDYRFQIEEVLLKKLQEPGKPLFVLIEDIERSETGAKLLESLHSFLSRNSDQLGRKLIVFTPTTKDFIYKKDNEKNRAQLERNLKIYDYIFEGWLRGEVDNLDTKVLFESFGCKDKRLLELLNFIISNIDHSKSLINIRSIQHMLREVDNFCYAHSGADPCVVLLYVSTKYVEYTDPYREGRVAKVLSGARVSPNEAGSKNNIEVLKKAFGIEDAGKYGIEITITDDHNVYREKNDIEKMYKISVPEMYKYILIG